MISTVRVLHVLAPGRRGGVEAVVAMLAEGQRGDGVHVAALVPRRERDNHPFLQRLHSLGIPVTVVAAGGRAYLRQYRDVSQLIGKLAPAVVHTHGYHADLVAGIAAHRAGIATVSTAHGFTGVPLRNMVYERLQLMAMRRADAVLAVSEALEQTLLRAGVQRVHLVPNGFTPPGEALSRLDARKKLGLAEDALVAGWVGRLSREKGADVVIEALAASDGDWRLSVVGEGPEGAKLRDLAARLGVSDHIRWHGSVDDAGRLFKAFDAFVLSSRTEGTPITLFEAMHGCTPIIATRVGGVPGVVNSSQAILVDAGDFAGIAAALAAVRNDPAASGRRASAAHERVIAQFGISSWLASVEAVYEKAIARHTEPHGPR